MKELAGRLSALDPEASETLKVIAYFDKLVDGRVGPDGMLRGAAVLCGAPMGHHGIEQDQGPRFTADGTALPPGPSSGWPSAASGDGEIVWLERQGPAHANDAMVLERLAIALSITTMRLDTLAPTRRAIEVLLSGDSSAEERNSAAARLSLGNHSVTYAIAVPASERLTTSLAHAMVATPHGIVRAVLAPGDSPPALRAGIGVAARSPEELQGSWRAALAALRLADEDHPVVRASDLGVLLALADAADTSSALHPDVALLGVVVAGPWTERMLRAVADGASQRALAIAAGVHHSTMGIRLQKLPELLGYDPLTPSGRTRLDVTLMLHKLATVRFDGSP